MVTIFVVLIALAAQSERPLVSICDVVKSPQLFSGKMVRVRAQLAPLGHGEFGIHGDCWPPMLLVLPDEVSRPAPFRIEETQDFVQLMAAQRRFALFEATFEGRVDWIEAQVRQKNFGRSNQTLRFVLQKVSDSKVSLIGGR